MAQQLAITERHVLRAIDDLCADGYVTVMRSVRSNVSTVHRELLLRSPLTSGRTVGELLAVFAPAPRQHADEP